MCNTIIEWCSTCGEEIEIPEVFKVHICPECGEKLFPCSMCDTDKVDCLKCPLLKKRS